MTLVSSMSKRPPVRVNLRIPAELFDQFNAIALNKYEGHLSMTAREAFRRYIAQELPNSAGQGSTARDIAEQEEAKAA